MLLNAPALSDAFVKTVEVQLRCHHPAIVALVGLDSTDAYVISIEPEQERTKFRPYIWGLVSQGSYFARYLNWFSLCVKSHTAEWAWIGIEVIVPHATRSAYIEACFCLFRTSDAIKCLTELATLPIKTEIIPHNDPTGYIECTNDPVALMRKYTCAHNTQQILVDQIGRLGRGKRVAVATTPFGDGHDKKWCSAKKKRRSIICYCFLIILLLILAAFVMIKYLLYK